MPLDDLLRLVETLRARINAHGDLLGQNETRTRYALIDPLLRELGWDTSDPAQVVPEYRSERGSADYALLGEDGKPQIIVEAKKLGTPPRSAAEQVINYCTLDGFDYFAVTDGGRWELYETHRRGDLKEKMVTSLDIEAMPLIETCQHALALWRPGVLAGSVRPAEPPVLANMEGTPIPSQSDPTTQMHNIEGWESMTVLKPESHSKPSGIMLPNGMTKNVTSWINFMVELVIWLANENHLTEMHAPIQYGNRYILTTGPSTPDGKGFTRERQAGPFFVETNYGGRDMVARACRIIEHTGLDPAQFRVRLRD